MKKSWFLSLLAAFFLVNAHAQLRVALVAGPHISSVQEKNNLPGADSISNGYQGRTGFHFGFVGDLQLSPSSPFYFQPGFVFYNKGRKFSYFADSLHTDPGGSLQTRYFEDGSQYLNYIDIPLNLVYKKKIGGNTRLVVGGGPYLSFFYNGSEKRNRNLVDVGFESEENNDLPVGNGPGKYKTLDYGVNALAGIEFKRVFLTANYSRGLGDFYTASYDGRFNHQVMGATLGIFIGQPVDISDKPKDRDNDGVVDTEDLCPDQPGLAITKGCPDGDGDGIADIDDKCPAKAGLSRYGGCPIPDSDNDGVNDEEDACKDIAGIAEYKGCPVPDTDSDGINDKEDKCPNQAGFARYAGCPIPDTDGDGINDELDKCPETVGIAENKGCPPVQEEIVKKVEFAAKNIQFQNGKVILTKASLEVLEEIVAILQANPELKLMIEGHSSSEGDPRFNQMLSENRARAVLTQLVKNGISADRLQSVGYGSSRPLNEEKTREERALNRRVELKLSNN